MNLFTVRGFATQSFHGVMAILVITLLSAGNSAFSQQAEQPAAAPAAAAEAPKIPNDQLDSLVAPIALYPDPLLAQTLAASTYPLEIIQLEQWMAKNPTLKDKALADAVAKQSWDASVQSMAAYPDVLKQLAENVAWSSDLGNAFLSQQADVMDAVQRMRAKAEGKGALKSSSQQKVETKTVESKQVIVIQPADPEVIYVPQYSPTVVYGEPPYPYPYYPAYTGALAFGAGIALGAAWGGHWGDCDWDNHGDVNINNKNNFNKNTNINAGNRNQAGGGKWQHNPQHRGGAPYGDRGTANKYGGRARQQPAGAAGAGNRPGGAAGTRPGGGAGAGNRPGGGAGAATRPAGGSGASTRPAGGGGGARAGGGGSNMASRPSGGGGDRIGNQSLGGSSSSRGGGGGSRDFGSSSPSFSSSSRGGGFGGGGGGSSARASSSRGGSSMGGGGFSGGGGRGGGGGGGRRR